MSMNGKKKKRWIWWAAGAAVAVILVIILTGAGRARTNAPVTVEASKLKPATISVTISGTGTIEAAEFVEMRASTNGLIDEVLVRSGDTVQAGQPLVKMTARLAQSQYDQAVASVDVARAQMNQLMARSGNSNNSAVLQLRQAEAQLQSAKARLAELERGSSATVLAQAEASFKQAVLSREEAEKDYERMKDLYDQGAVAKAQLEAAKAKLESAKSQEKAASQAWQSAQAGPTETELAAARAQVAQAQTALELAQIGVATRGDEEASARAKLRQAEAQLASAREELENAVLRSPFSGKVLSVPAQSGASVTAGMLLVTVGRPGGLVAKIAIDEVDVVRLRNGMEGRINTDAAMDRSFAGTVTYISAQGTALSNGSTGATFEVHVAVQEGLEVLRPGMTVDVEIEVERKNAGIAIPLQAIIEEEMNGARNRYVFVVKNNVARRMEISLGLSNETMAEIISGITADDMVITGDYGALKQLTDGAQVVVNERKGPNGKRGNGGPGGPGGPGMRRHP